ncbi:MAG: 16S rRNA (guanine(527)-N(7))-methyltransferase RsmG [Chloroflexi bacterium]|nr:MAG: 16S rRNA (guanine(527)-N(7))-methyltransferase RsmG [Chloroflexota bacterium]
MDLAMAVGNGLRKHLSAVQHEQLEMYLQRLLESRRRANLTALRDRQSIERRHFGESAALLDALERAGVVESPVIDIGTGAGIPGLPFKIARPDLDITLVESSARKTQFLEEMVRELRLSGVAVCQARAEDAAHDPAHRGAYTLALARAVAPLRILAELALPFLRFGGYLATPKGSGAEREVHEATNALAVCGGAVELVERLGVVGPGPPPTLVLVRKAAETPERYPRRAGIPRKRPL